ASRHLPPGVKGELETIRRYSQRSGKTYVVDAFWSAWEAFATSASYRETVERAVRYGTTPIRPRRLPVGWREPTGVWTQFPRIGVAACADKRRPPVSSTVCFERPDFSWVQPRRAL